jgi:transposase
MLRRGDDYAHQRPALTKKKLRELELTAGAKPRTKAAVGIWSTNRAIRDAERALTEQAEISYKRMVTDQKAGRRREKWARARHRSAHELGPRTAKLRGRLKGS